MILLVSGRTDIVAFYTPWFMNRLKEGYVDVLNPFNSNLVNRIYFKDVDAFMFCTKNPWPIIPYLDKINKPILFHITLTPYKNDIEPNVIDKRKIIEGIKKVSKIIGKDNVYVRYDPVFLNNKYNLDYHLKAFSKLCSLLDGYIKGFIISFLDDYKNVQKNYHILKPKIWENKDYETFGICFANIAKKHNLTVQTCAEAKTLEEYGFIKGECLSKEIAQRLTGKKVTKKWTARHNKNCACMQMVDIGAYNTCPHLCLYCYANYAPDLIKSNREKHDVNSSLLIGHINENTKIVVRR